MSAPRIDRLLRGKNLPTRQEKEDVLARVLEDPRVRPARAKRILWWGALSAVMACVIAFVLIRAPQEELTARGGNEQLLAVRCSATSDGACHPGDKLFVGAASSKTLPYFAAFLQASDGRIWWIAPNQSAQPATGVSEALAWLPQALVLDATLSGSAKVHGVFLAQPLTQKEIAERVERREVKTIERTIEVTAP